MSSQNPVSITSFKTNKQAELGGVWVEAEGGLKLCIARMNNPRYVAKLRELTIPYQDRLRQSSKKYRKQGEATPENFGLDADLLKKLVIEAASTTILLGWENLAEPQGENNELTDVPYSSEKAQEYMLAYDEFYLMVMEIANDEALYRENVLETSKGN